MSIKRLAEEDRPREKLGKKGKAALTDAELIAILLGSGSREKTAVELAREILNHCGNDLNNLARLSLKDLQKFKGMGEAKAISILSAFEIGRRRQSSTWQKRPVITSSSEAFRFICGDLQDLGHEEFWMILLKRNNEVIQKEMLSKGGVSGTVVDPKIIFKRALEETASGVILAHNHPSGNLQPSREDIQITRKIKEAGLALEVNLIDHLIVAGDSFYSFADESNL